MLDSGLIHTLNIAKQPLSHTVSGVVEEKRRGTPFPQIFCGGTPIPQMIPGQGGTVIQKRFPKQACKKCKVCDKLTLRKIIEIIATR